MIAYFCGDQPIMSHVRKLILTSSDFSIGCHSECTTWYELANQICERISSDLGCIFRNEW